MDSAATPSHRELIAVFHEDHEDANERSNDHNGNQSANNGVIRDKRDGGIHSPSPGLSFGQSDIRDECLRLVGCVCDLGHLVGGVFDHVLD